MPVYNGARWLSRAIESVLVQTVTDFELVVVDDGSTDDSVSIVESFVARDSRVRLVRTAHAGLRPARGLSLAEARSSFVAFLDHDDEWLPTRLERQLPHADERTVVFSDVYFAYGDKRTRTRQSSVNPPPSLRYPATGLFPDLLTRDNFIPMLTVLAPRELLVEAGGFRYGELHGIGSDEDAEDYEMWLLLALRGVSFHYVDEPLAVYRWHGDSVSADRLRMLRTNAAVFRGLMSAARGSERSLLREARRRQRRGVEIAHRKRGWEQIVAGDAASGWRELVCALRVRPLSLRAWLALPLPICPPLARRLVRGRI